MEGNCQRFALIFGVLSRRPFRPIRPQHRDDGDDQAHADGQCETVVQIMVRSG